MAKLKNEKSEEKKTNASAMKKLESELQKYRSYAGTIPHLQKQLETISQEKKKSKAIPKDSGSGDKLNSEYEMLLSEKDAIIAEYLSGLEFNP